MRTMMALSFMIFCSNTFAKKTFTYATYKNDSDVTDNLDLDYYKYGSKSSPLIIYLHGGGWARGTKEDKRDNFINDIAKKSGSNLIRLDYRKGSNDFGFESVHNDFSGRYPGAMIDLDCALRWVNTNFKSKNVTVVGTSVGAYTALSKLIRKDEYNSLKTPNFKCRSNSKEVKVDNLISFYSPVNIDSAFNSSTSVLRKYLKNFVDESNSAEADLFLATEEAKKLSLRTLFVHGQDDPLVNFTSDGAKYFEVFQLKNTKETFNIWPKNGKHGLLQKNDSLSKKLSSEVVKFLNKEELDKSLSTPTFIFSKAKFGKNENYTDSQFVFLRVLGNRGELPLVCSDSVDDCSIKEETHCFDEQGSPIIENWKVATSDGWYQESKNGLDYWIRKADRADLPGEQTSFYWSNQNKKTKALYNTSKAYCLD